MKLTRYLNSRSLLSIFATIISGILVVATLVWSTESPNTTKNGFVRKFLPLNIEMGNVIPRQKIVTGLSGISKTQIYLQTIKPGKIIILDHELKYLNTIDLDMTLDAKTALAFDCKVDSPNIYFFAGNSPAVITGNLNSEFTKKYKFPLSIFTKGTFLSPSSFAFRGYDTTIKSIDQIFLKGYPSSGIIKRETKVLDRTGDGGMSSDGILHFDSVTKSLVYILFYSNKYISMDTNLNIKYVATTLDTVSYAAARIEGVKSGKVTTYSNHDPSKVINWDNCIDGGILYNNSWLKGDNETPEQFRNNSAIDAYNLEEGKYEGSFYLPKYNGEKAFKFKIFGSKVIALYNDYIILYKINK